MEPKCACNPIMVTLGGSRGFWLGNKYTCGCNYPIPETANHVVVSMLLSTITVGFLIITLNLQVRFWALGRLSGACEPEGVDFGALDQWSRRHMATALGLGVLYSSD